MCFGIRLQADYRPTQRKQALSSRDKGRERLFTLKIKERYYGSGKTPHPVRLHGAAARPAGAVRPDGGHFTEKLLPLRLHPPGYPGGGGGGGAAGQGRRRDREADLPFPDLHQNELTFPFRRFQIAKVYRGERAQKGRYREFYQADIDVIGDGALDIINEAEIPAIIYKTFTALGLSRFKIRVNNRKVLNGLFAILGLEEQAGDVMRTIDKLEKIGPEKVKAILVDDFSVSAGAADSLLTLLAADDPMAALEPFKGKNERFDQGVSELSTVVGYLSAFGVPEDHFMVDLTIARGLDYYTGTVYETVMLDHPEVGSICSGGRYDNLAEYYTDKQLPGVGISIGLTRLFSVLEAQGYLNDGLVTAPADVLILPMTEDLSPAISFATALREAGVRAQLHCEKKKFKQKLSYADKLAIPYAAFLGEDEIAQGKVTVKDLTSGEQNTLTPAEAVALVQAGLAQRSAGAPITEPQL